MRNYDFPEFTLPNIDPLEKLEELEKIYKPYEKYIKDNNINSMTIPKFSDTDTVDYFAVATSDTSDNTIKLNNLEYYYRLFIVSLKNSISHKEKYKHKKIKVYLYTQNSTDPGLFYNMIITHIDMNNYLNTIVNIINLIFLSDHIPIFNIENNIMTWNVEHDIILLSQLCYNYKNLCTKKFIDFFNKYLLFIIYKNFIILNIIIFLHKNNYICCLQECNIILLYLLLYNDDIDNKYIKYTLRPWHERQTKPISTNYRGKKKESRNDIYTHNINKILETDNVDGRCIFIVYITILTQTCKEITLVSLPNTIQKYIKQDIVLNIKCSKSLEFIQNIYRIQKINYTNKDIINYIFNIHLKSTLEYYEILKRHILNIIKKTFTIIYIIGDFNQNINTRTHTLLLEFIKFINSIKTNFIQIQIIFPDKFTYLETNVDGIIIIKKIVPISSELTDVPVSVPVQVPVSVTKSHVPVQVSVTKLPVPVPVSVKSSVPISEKLLVKSSVPASEKLSVKSSVPALASEKVSVPISKVKVPVTKVSVPVLVPVIKSQVKIKSPIITSEKSSGIVSEKSPGIASEKSQVHKQERSVLKTVHNFINYIFISIYLINKNKIISNNQNELYKLILNSLSTYFNTTNNSIEIKILNKTLDDVFKFIWKYIKKNKSITKSHIIKYSAKKLQLLLKEIQYQNTIDQIITILANFQN
jgi:type IV secretory pathway VirB3-like protein